MLALGRKSQWDKYVITFHPVSKFQSNLFHLEEDSMYLVKTPQQ